MRIAIAGLYEEVNTFAVETMGLARITGSFATGFQKFSGDALVARTKGTRTYMGGYLDALGERADIEIVPLTVWMFGAGPTIERAAYEEMKKELLDGFAAAMPIDAVALQLHGAAIAEGIDDVEYDLTAAIRKLVGPKVKMVCSTDLHGNVTDGFLEQMDLITTVVHYPHIDEYDAAYRAGKLLPDMVDGKVQPVGRFEHLPFIMQMCSTMEGTLFEPIRKKVEEFSKRDGIIEFAYFYGFPLTDISFNTATVNCWATSEDLAASTAREFASWVWENRRSFVVAPVPAAEAVQAALTALAAQGRVKPDEASTPSGLEEALARLATPPADQLRFYGFLPDAKTPGPVVIAEKSDNPGCGAPGDSTHVLWELLRNRVQQAAVSSIRDVETVQQAMKAGVGAIIDVVLGGKLSKQSGEPVRGKAYVKTISDGRYTTVSPMGLGGKIDMGPAVGLMIDGVDVAVISGGMQPFDNGQLRMVGFDPRDYRIVVVKSANHFRAWWTDVASQIIDCDPPGIASNDLTTFVYSRKTRKLFPLDADAVYPESSARA
ncbi:M81 family metallopeptidase [Variovorax sp. YR216]|uniref:M81 family metallopeptidase n=1 Tax=Variovorax sp. YR216 TaxID=1882828 RepID=UPI00089948E9|nr:M81 family metallopeptidase [Variovorax sp. YR216]SEB18977.1 Microcystin degradation protein MlrC, contains DUF1485 domain [Variovorax sp. YR216]